MNNLKVLDKKTQNSRRTPSPSERFIPDRSGISMEKSFHLLSSSIDKTPLLDNYYSQRNIVNVSHSETSRSRYKSTDLYNKYYLNSSNAFQTIDVQFNYSPVVRMETPNIIDDFYLNLIDWSPSNILVVAVQKDAYLYKHASRETIALDLDFTQTENKNQFYSNPEFNEQTEVMTCVKWSPWNENFLAIGLSDHTVNIWDIKAKKLVHRIKNHGAKISSIDWNSNDIITSGDRDGLILNHDLRTLDTKPFEFKLHKTCVCGLKWNKSKHLLASGSDDKNVIIWDLTKSSKKPLHVFSEYKAAIKAIDWCPWKSNILATGSGKKDGRIQTWDIHNGKLLESIETDCQVSGVSWCENTRYLTGSYEHNISSWKYPKFKKVGELEGHEARILSLIKSNEDMYASLGADEQLRIWDCFVEQKDMKKFSFINSPISTRSLASSIR